MNCFSKRFLGILVSLLGLTIFVGIVYFYKWNKIERDINATRGRSVLNHLNINQYSNFLPNNAKDQIILISIDTLRTDHLSTYGYDLTTSPYLTSLAQNQATKKFTRAFAPMNVTTPSHTSMLTGLYPLQHRVLSNYHQMSKSITTLPELLNSAGYTTAGFVSTDEHFKPANLNQGFDVFNEPSEKEMYAPFPGKDTEQVKIGSRQAHRTLAKAREWLRDHSTEPFFLFIHLYDPHTPYSAPANSLRTIYKELRNKQSEYHRFIRNKQKFEQITESPRSTALQNSMLGYDAEVHFVDRALKRFFNSLKSHEVGPGESFIAITGDHGEGLGNHGYWGHANNIHNEQIRVPLLIHDPETSFKHSTQETVVEINDLAPTILLEANVSKDLIKKHREHNLHGEPLQFLYKKNQSLPDGEFGHAFSQRTAGKKLSTLRYYLLPVNEWWQNYKRPHEIPINFPVRGNQFTLINDRSKYIHHTINRDEFYNLRNDFYEQRNLINTDVSKMKQRAISRGSILLHERARLTPESPRPTRSVDSSTRKGLKNLGYVQ